MISRMWKDILSEIGLIEKVEYIIENLLMPDKIDPEIFVGNYEYLLYRGSFSFNTLFNKEDNKKTSLSIINFRSSINRAPIFPLWFYAAYPDVMVWYDEWRKEYLRSHKYDYDAIVIEAAKLFGVNIEDETINENQIIDRNGKHPPKLLINLVNSYKSNSGNKLETQVSSPSNIYSNYELKEELGLKDDNFILIAKNTTKYYMELYKKYKEKFKDQVTILSIAGIIDAQVYVFIEKTIDISVIQEIAINAINKQEPLIDFIINLEVLIFKVDSPTTTTSEIENACKSQRNRIEIEINNILQNYQYDAKIAEETKIFMNSSQFKLLRKQLGIRNKF